MNGGSAALALIGVFVFVIGNIERSDANGSSRRKAIGTATMVIGFLSMMPAFIRLWINAILGT